MRYFVLRFDADSGAFELGGEFESVAGALDYINGSLKDGVRRCINDWQLIEGHSLTLKVTEVEMTCLIKKIETA